MIAMALAVLLMQDDKEIWEGPEFRPGPHTLIISDGSAITRIDYKSGPACARARDAIRKQTASPPDTRDRIHGPPRTRAFCVPR